MNNYENTWAVPGSRDGPNSEGNLEGRFPQPRERQDYTPGGKGATFDQYQSTNGYIALTNAYVEIIRFAGVPAEIEISVLNNDALIYFADDGETPRDPILVKTNNFYNPQVRARRVYAKNALPDQIGNIQVVGKWCTCDGKAEDIGR